MWCSNLTPLATVNRVLLLLVITMAECNTCGPGLITPGVTIPKGDIMIESGEPLEIFCVLNKSIDIAANRSARDLIFLRDSKVVPSEFLEIINETTVRLYVKQPPPSESMYYCKLQTPADELKPGQSRNTAVCLNKVFVGTKPQEVKNFTCISQNWQNLTCSWEKPENFVKTKYKLRYRFPGRAGGRMQYGCPSNTDETSNYCFWNDSTDPHYRLPYAYYYYNLTGENQFGNASFSHKFHHYGHVIPAPPTDLSISGTTHNSVLLNWSIPYAMHTFPPGLIQRVVYQAEYDTNDIWLPANTSNLKTHGENHSLNITGLKYAYMLYEVRISMKSSVATGEDKWSTPTNITFMTSAIVPGAPPKTDIGSFEVSGGLLRDVYIYWRYIPNEMKNGDKFEYKIISVEENGQKRYCSQL
ncbi:unnamed protein product [Timema podura]|uniref:Fibronectin type-III domain-containing protein n=1 Tax=Timema podura TaxID=61482 RepID=A0ABN7NJE8_TIMPD|nr:unnamed protein product [Timema podura]